MSSGIGLVSSLQRGDFEHSATLGKILIADCQLPIADCALGQNQLAIGNWQSAMTMNLYDRIHACRGDEVEEIWPVMDRYHEH